MLRQLAASLLILGLILIVHGLGSAGVVLVLAGFGVAYSHIAWLLWRVLRPWPAPDKDTPPRQRRRAGPA